MILENMHLYEIGPMIGEGGFAQVFMAKNKLTNE